MRRGRLVILITLLAVILIAVLAISASISHMANYEMGYGYTMRGVPFYPMLVTAAIGFVVGYFVGQNGKQ